MIITVCLNPALDKTLFVDGFWVDGVNRVLSTRKDPGGKSVNVAKLVKVLEGDTLATGIVGGENGEFIRRELDKMAIRHDFVTSEHPTRTNLKINDRLRHTTTELNEPGAPVTEELLAEVWAKIDAAAKAGDTVVISGANPPGMADDVLAKWITALNEKGVFTALDTVGAPMKLGIQAKPNLIKPNINELSELFGEELHYQRDVIAAARQIVQQGVERVVVSMGAEGALFVTREHVLHSRGVHVSIGSTVGSGDAMLAAVVHYLQQGASWEEAARWSVATGGANAMCEGSATPTMEQIKAVYERVSVDVLL